MTGVARKVVISRPENNPFNEVEFFMLRETKSWKEAVKVITQTEEPMDNIHEANSVKIYKSNTNWNPKKAVSN